MVSSTIMSIRLARADDIVPMYEVRLSVRENALRDRGRVTLGDSRRMLVGRDLLERWWSRY
jgi:hypothetical protein